VDFLDWIVLLSRVDGGAGSGMPRVALSSMPLCGLTYVTDDKNEVTKIETQGIAD